MDQVASISVEVTALDSKPTSVRLSSIIYGKTSIRPYWKRRIYFILSCIGYAVGPTNFLIYPFRVLRNGGFVFILVYFIMHILIGIPLLLLEFTISQFTSKGVLGCWNFVPGLKGIGILMMWLSFLCCLYYNTLVAWNIYYFLFSFTPILPWNSCSNDWNNYLCLESDFRGFLKLNQNVEMSSEQFLMRKAILQVETLSFNTSRLVIIEDGLGTLVWYIALCAIAAWLICTLILMFGIQILGKIMCFITIYPYFVLLVLFFFCANLEGSKEGIKYYFQPDFQKILSLSLWYDAAELMFFSLGLGIGGMVTFGSYNDFYENIEQNICIIGLINYCTSLLTGVISFQILGFMAYRYEKKVADMAEYVGIRLSFLAYPEAFSQFRTQNVLSVLFFIMLIFLGVSSQVGLIETVLTGFCDEFPWLRSRKSYRMYLAIGVDLGCCILSMLFATKTGYHWYTIVDTFALSSILLILGFLESFTVIFVYGIDNLSRDFKMMLGNEINWFCRICLLVPVPITTSILTCFSLYSNKRIVIGTGYTKITFFIWVDILRWLLFSISVLILPIYFVYYVLKTRKLMNISITEALGKTMIPDMNYGPADKNYWKVEPFYKLKYKTYRHSPHFMFNKFDSIHEKNDLEV